MNVNKLRVGTKIKLLQDNAGGLKKGMIGFLCNDSSFHGTEGLLRDNDGDLWMNPEEQHTFNNYCIVTKNENPEEFFKVLKY